MLLKNSQDPREYLPFLRKLQQLPATRRKFEIDNHLSRFEKALGHLYTLNVHDEISAYVVKHVLYKEALGLYKYQTEQLREITELYADYLHDQSKFKDAAIGKWISCNAAIQNESLLTFDTSV